MALGGIYDVTRPATRGFSLLGYPGMGARACMRGPLLTSSLPGDGDAAYLVSLTAGSPYETWESIFDKGRPLTSGLPRALARLQRPRTLHQLSYVRTVYVLVKIYLLLVTV